MTDIEAFMPRFLPGDTRRKWLYLPSIKDIFIKLTWQNKWPKLEELGVRSMLSSD
jgi:hypothetical protein